MHFGGGPTVNRNAVWDVNTLAWVAMRQPIISTDALTVTTTNDGTFAKETGGNLASLAAKDFATQTTVALIKAKTDNLDVLLSSRTKPADQQHVIVDSSAAIAVTGPVTDTQLRASAIPVSATSLPLPTGAAIEAGHLATIDAHIPAQGRALAAASMPVVMPAADITTLTPPAAIVGFALEAGHLAAIDTHIPAQGQGLMAASVPVVLASDQSTVSVSVLSSTTGAAKNQIVGTTGGVSATVKGSATTPANTDNVLAVGFRPIDAATLGTVLAASLALDSSLTTLDTDLKATQPRDVTDRAGRLVGVVSEANLDVAQGAAAASQAGPMVQATVEYVSPHLLTGVLSPASLDLDRRLRVMLDKPNLQGAIEALVAEIQGLRLEAYFQSGIGL